jgi:hypothetical protein
MWRIILAAMLILISDACGQSKIRTCIDPYRPEAVVYFGGAVPDCKLHIYPYCLINRQDSSLLWYLLLDKPGEYVERLVFTTGDVKLTCPRTVTPNLVCYDYKPLTLAEAAWIDIPDSLFSTRKTIGDAFLEVERADDSHKKIKFTPKARANLLAFHDSVLTRLNSGALNRLPNTPLHCDSISLTNVDSVNMVFPWMWPLDRISRWTKYDTTLLLLNVDDFTVRIPKSWAGLRDTTTGTIHIGPKGGGAGLIQIFPIIVAPYQWNQPEALIADQIRREQERAMLEQGVWRQQFELREVDKGTACLGGLRTYYLGCRQQTILSPAGILKEFHLWFPPDFRDTHRLYIFLFNGADDRFQLGIFDYYNALSSLRPKAEP